jgi:hypothetical protein
MMIRTPQLTIYILAGRRPEVVRRPGLFSLLASCSQLEQSVVSSYDSHGFFYEDHEESRRQQAHKLLQARLPVLRAIYLGGMGVQVADLNRFLIEHSALLRSIEIALILNLDAALSTILNLIAGDKFRLNNMRLIDINDEYALRAYYDKMQVSPYTEVSGVYYYRSTIHRRGPDTKKVNNLLSLSLGGTGTEKHTGMPSGGDKPRLNLDVMVQSFLSHATSQGLLQSYVPGSMGNG